MGGLQKKCECFVVKETCEMEVLKWEAWTQCHFYNIPTCLLTSDTRKGTMAG